MKTYQRNILKQINPDPVLVPVTPEPTSSVRSVPVQTMNHMRDVINRMSQKNGSK